MSNEIKRFLLPSYLGRAICVWTGAVRGDGQCILTLERECHGINPTEVHIDPSELTALGSVDNKLSGVQ